jgi:hypothetical protein
MTNRFPDGTQGFSIYMTSIPFSCMVNDANSRRESAAVGDRSRERSRETDPVEISQRDAATVVIFEKGLEHERRHLVSIKAKGLAVVEFKAERFDLAERTALTRVVIRAGAGPVQGAYDRRRLPWSLPPPDSRGGRPPSGRCGECGRSAVRSDADSTRVIVNHEVRHSAARSSTCSATRVRGSVTKDLLIEAIRYGERPEVRNRLTKSSRTRLIRKR